MNNEEFNEILLIVDDDEDVRYLLKHEFEKLRIKVISAADGVQALRLFRENKIFLILSDYFMPNMDGLELCTQIRETNVLVPFILFTGYGNKEIAVSGLRHGITNFLEKPEDIPKLKPLVASYKNKRINDLKKEQEEMLVLRQVFKTEAQEMFEDIDKWILRLEEIPLDANVVNTVFRKIHTLKGTAGAFAGAEMIAKIVHVYETLLVKLKNLEIAISRELIDLLLRVADYVKILINNFCNAEEPANGTDDFIIEINSFLSGDIVINDIQTETKKVNINQAQINNNENDEEDNILVSNEKMLTFMELSGELIVFKNTMQNVMKQFMSENHNDKYRQTVDDFVHSLDKISEQFQKHIMEIRKVSLDKAFTKFPRIIRQVSQELKKDIKLEMIGTKLGVDKSIAKALGASLIHLIRNSADHGIENTEIRLKRQKSETGKIIINCNQIGDVIQITIEDDGGGINRDKVLKKALTNSLISEEQLKNISDSDIYDLLFLPGFSTAESVSNVSGRGVGMDVVKSEIIKLGGSLKLDSELEKGTKFSINIPVPKTVMVEYSILAKSGEIYLAIPLSNIEKISPINDAKPVVINNLLTCQHKNKTIPVAFFHEYLNFYNFKTYDKRLGLNNTNQIFIVVSHKNRSIGLIVDEIIEQQEAVIRPFDKVVEEIPGFKGTSILNNEIITFVINSEEMINIALKNFSVVQGAIA